MESPDDCSAKGCEARWPLQVRDCVLFCHSHWLMLPTSAQRVLTREFLAGAKGGDGVTMARALIAQAVAVTWIAWIGGLMTMEEASAHMGTMTQGAIASGLPLSAVEALIVEMRIDSGKVYN